MATERLKVILEMAASQYKREAREAATATGKIAETVTKTGAATGQMETRLSSAGRGMTDFAKVATTALAVRALGAVKDFTGDAKRAYSDLNESLNALEVQYGEHADGIKALGREAATGLGLSNAEFNTFAVSSSAFAKQIAEDSGDVVGVVDDLTTRVSDFASVMNLEVAEAAEKFQSGLAGESEPLRKFGIDVSDAKVKAFALSAGIWDGVDAMTESEKVQARYGTIMEQTNAVAGDFAETSDELANKTRIANAQMENSKAIIGQALKGAYEQALPLQVGLAEGAAEVAIAFLKMTEAITETEAQTLRLNLATGGSVETLDELAAAVERDNRKLSSLWSSTLRAAAAEEEFENILGSVKDQLIAQPGFLDLTQKSVQELRFEAENLGREYGWTRDQVSAFIDMLLFQRDVQMDTTSGDMWLEGLRQGGELTSNLTEETEEATAALRDFFDLMDSRLGSLRNVNDAMVEAQEKQDAVTEAFNEFGDGSPEYLAALTDLSIANQDLREAQRRLIEEGGLTRAEFIDQQVEMGLTYQQALILAEQYDELFTPRHATNTITNQITNVTTNTLGGSVGGGSAVVAQARAGGGPMTARNLYRVGEGNLPEIYQADKSLYMIPGDQGRMFSNAQSEALIAALANSGGSSKTFEIHLHGPINGVDEVMGAVQRAGGMVSIIDLAEVNPR